MEPITDKHEIFEGRGFEPIPDLLPGDKVRWRNLELRCDRWPRLRQVITVHRVMEPIIGAGATSGSSGYCALADFTALFLDPDGGHVREYAFDSRRFERA